MTKALFVLACSLVTAHSFLGSAPKDPSYEDMFETPRTVTVENPRIEGQIRGGFLEEFEETLMRLAKPFFLWRNLSESLNGQKACGSMFADFERTNKLGDISIAFVTQDNDRIEAIGKGFNPNDFQALGSAHDGTTGITYITGTTHSDTYFFFDLSPTLCQ